MLANNVDLYARVSSGVLALTKFRRKSTTGCCFLNLHDLTINVYTASLKLSKYECSCQNGGKYNTFTVWRHVGECVFFSWLLIRLSLDPEGRTCTTDDLATNCDHLCLSSTALCHSGKSSPVQFPPLPLPPPLPPFSLFL